MIFGKTDRNGRERLIPELKLNRHGKAQGSQSLSLECVSLSPLGDETQSKRNKIINQ